MPKEMKRATGAVLASARHTVQVGLAVVGLAACQVESPIDLQDPGDAPRFEGCDLNVDFLIAAAARGGIQSLDNPRWVRADESIPAYLDPDTRVIGIQVFGLVYAIPHNILWHHEVVNLEPGGPSGPQLAITYCPLTGSSLVFDRESVGGATLGVSGLTFMNNLVLFDRRGPDEALWPQMLAEARCGSGIGAKLAQHPFVEMEWAHWVELHPSTRVLAQDQGFDPIFFQYDRLGYPYGNYRESEPYWRAATTMPPLDRRRFSKERVVGLPPTASDAGIAFPFGALTDRAGPFQVVAFVSEGNAAPGVDHLDLEANLWRWVVVQPRYGDRVGGGVVNPAVPPHHRAYGPVHGGSTSPIQLSQHCEKTQQSPLSQALVGDCGVHMSSTRIPPGTPSATGRGPVGLLGPQTEAAQVRGSVSWRLPLLPPALP